MRTKTFEPDEIADAAMEVFWRRGYAATLGSGSCRRHGSVLQQSLQHL